MAKENKNSSNLVWGSKGNYYKLFCDNAAVMLLIDPSSGNILDANNAASEFYGYSHNELTTMKIQDINTLSDEQVTAEMERAKKMEQNHFLFEHRLANGIIRHVDVYSGKITINGKPLLFSIVHDNTERKRIELELKESESSLRYAQKIAGMGSWELDLINQKIKWSENLFFLFGLNPFEVEPTFEYLKSRIHPNDLHLVYEGYGNIIRTKEPDSFEMRIIFPDGDYKWFMNQLIPISQDGKLITVKGISLDITKRKLIEEEISKQKELLQRIIDNIPVMITYFDKTGKINLVNNEVVRILGWTFNEWETDNIFAKSYPEPEYLKEILDFMVSGDSGWKECRTNTKYGTIIDTSWINIKLSNGFSMGIGQDITQRKKSEEKLRESESKYRELVENSPDAIIIYQDKKIVFANSESLRLIGAECIEDLSDKSVIEFVHLDSRALVIERMKKLQNIGTVLSIAEEKFVRFDSTVIDVEVKAMSIMFEHKRAVQLIIRNITERKQAESELIKAKEQAEESDRLKTAFLHNMSHEVRTPLNAIVGFSQILAEPNQPSEQLKAFSDIISASSDKLIEIITDVIEMSKIQSNQIEIKLTEIDIVLFISNIVNSFKEKAKEKNITLIYNQNITDNAYLISSDKEKLKKIFTHLIDNAIKFTHRGSVEITCDIQQDNLRVLISDTGIGISAESQEIIFEPFRQLENELHRNYGGNGLGLPIVKAYTELLTGSISLKSEINIGTTVIVTIPIKKSGVEPSKNVINETNYSRLDFGTDYPVNTILIAEDEYTNFRYLSELLNPLKIEILHAINGQQAIDFCRNNSAVDLILMDIRMPIIDGHTAAKLIKAFRPNLPIIAQTAYATKDEKNKYLDIFDDYITKPIDKDEFMLKIKKYFDK